MVKRALKNNGVYVSPSIQAGLPVYSAVDNCDLKNDTDDGNNKYEQSSANVVSEKLQINRNRNRSLYYVPFPAS